MPINRNVLMRIRTIDACLHRRNRLWTLEDLRQACEDALYDYEGIDGVSLRTVQRDIELMRGDKLGYFAPIVVRDKKYYSYSDPDFSITKLPLSEHDLQELGSAIDIIRHYQGFSHLKGQEDVLTRMQDQLQAQRSNRQVVFIETSSRLRGIHFLAPLYEHIRRQEQVVISYHSFRSAKESVFSLSPYLLNEYNNRWFLVAYSKQKHNIMTLALDRMLSVKKDEKGEYTENTFFVPEQYLGEMIGITRNLLSKPERVVLRFDADQAPYVLTKPMHQSQQLERREEDGGITVTLDVILNLELESKILAFAGHVEVLYPRLLRSRIARHLIAAAARYQQQ
ncbi:MAG: WYL domain-containing protein [Prevotellaceae bacterium]|nr:WYL domain-containing protein [Prevotellaceae bacterium]